MTINDFLIGAGLILFLMAWLSGVSTWWCCFLLLKNTSDMSDIKLTNPELYDEMKSKCKSNSPWYADPAGLKGDYAWGIMLDEKYITLLDRADELRNLPVYIEKKRIIKKMVFRLKFFVVSFVVSMSLFKYTGKF